jgi:hypothetical protein
MGNALCTTVANAGYPDCPVRHVPDRHWLQDLPTALQDMVVAPASFEVARDYEMSAERTFGRDASNAPCYCEFHYVVTQLRSDDDELYYEAPVYAETLTSWRLTDQRWLVRRTTSHNPEGGEGRIHLSLSDTMPR